MSTDFPTSSELAELVAIAAQARAVFPRRGIDKVEGVSGGQLEVLIAIAAFPDHPIAQLADPLCIDPTGVGRAVDALTEGKYLKPNEGYRRRLVLTSKGRRAVEAVAAHARALRALPPGA